MEAFSPNKKVTIVNGEFKDLTGLAIKRSYNTVSNSFEFLILMDGSGRKLWFLGSELSEVV